MHLQALQCFCKTSSQLGSSTLLTCTRKLPTELALLAAMLRLTGRQRCCFLTAPTWQHPESGCVGWDSCSAAETRKSAETKNLVGLEKRLNYVQMGQYLIKSLMNRDSSLLNAKPSGSHLFVFFPHFLFQGASPFCPKPVSFQPYQLYRVGQSQSGPQIWSTKYFIILPLFWCFSPHTLMGL